MLTHGDSAMAHARIVELQHEGTNLKGFLATPRDQQGKRAAVLIVHDAMGRGDFYGEKARVLAELGYVALAADMYGDGFHAETPEEAGKYFIAFHHNPALMRARVVALYEQLKSLPEVDETRVAAIGFCFGGQCVLELARSGADVKAVASYHGLLTTHAPAQSESVDTVVAVYTGTKDPYAPRDHVDALRAEMTAAGANLHLTEFSGAYHAFTNPKPPRGVEAGMQYDALCDRVSWAGTLVVLEQVLAG